MASKYPDQLDDDSTLPTVVDGAAENSAEAISRLRDATLAVQRALGENPNGVAQTLADRLDTSLNPDGTIKASALTGLGTVTLPITQDQISASAAIPESKLDLDRSTLYLQDQISSNDIDILNVQLGLSGLSGEYSEHVVGAADRHNASHITVSPAVFGGGTVAGELTAAASTIAAHIDDGYGAHHASAISIAPVDGLDAESVQEAIEVINQDYLANIEAHRISGHRNGIVAESGDLLGLLVTSYTYSGQTITKVSHLSAASAKSSGLVGAALSPSASSIQLDLYSDGYVQNIVISGIESAIDGGATYPTAQSIAKFISESISASNGLATAFAVDGEICIQHNLPDGYMVVSDYGASAMSALGFAEIAGEPIYPNFQNIVYSNGLQVSNLRTVSTGDLALVSPSATLDIGVPASVGMLVHVRSHSAGSIGTYRVVGASGNIATLSSAIPAGDGAFVIFSDSLQLTGPYSGRQYRLDIASDGDIDFATEVSATSLNTTSYALLGAPANSAFTLQYVLSSPNVIITADDGYVSSSVSFPVGYVGSLAPMPLSQGDVKLAVVDAAPDTGVTDSFSSTDIGEGFAKVWMIGASGQSYVADTRAGITGLQQLGAVTVTGVRAGQSDYGVVSGAAPTAAGSVVVLPPQTWVSGPRSGVSSYAALDALALSGECVAYLKYDGEIAVGGETGNSLADILARQHVPLCVFDASDPGGTLVDVRFLSDFTTIWSSFSVGRTAVSLAGALLLAAATGANLVTCDDAAVGALTVSGGVHLHVRGDLSVSGDLTVSGATLTVDGQTTADSLQATDATLEFNGPASLISATSVVTDSVIRFTDMVVDSVQATDATMMGIQPMSPLTIVSGSTGSIECSAQVWITDASVSRTVAALPLVIANSGATLVATRSALAQTGSVLSSANMASASYAAIRSSGATLKIDEVSKTNISYLVDCVSGSTSVVVDRSTSTASGGAISVNGSGTSVTASLNGVAVYDPHGIMFQVGVDAVAEISTTNSVFTSSLPVSSSLRIVSSAISGTAYSSMKFNDCSFVGLLSSTQSVFGTRAEVAFTGCLFDGCQFDGLVCGSGNQLAANSYVGGKYVDCAGVFMYGSNMRVLNNVVSYASGGTNNISVVSQRYTAILQDNDITMPSSAGFNLRDCSVSGNRMSAGSFVFGSTQIVGGSVGYQVTNNVLYSTDTGSPSAFSLTGTGTPIGNSPPPCMMTGNALYGSPTTQLVRINHTGSSLFGAVEFSGNSLNYQLPTSGTAMLRVQSVSAFSGDQYSIRGNTMRSAGSSGAISYGVLLEDGYVELSGNTIDAADLTNAVINGVSGRCVASKVTNNTVLAIPVAIDTLSAISLPSGAGNYLAANRGIKTAISVAPQGGFVASGSWTCAAGANMESATSGAGLCVSLPPVSGSLVAVEVDLTTGGAGTASAAVYELRKQPLSNLLIGTATNTLATQTLSVSAPVSINENSGFYVFVTASATNVQIGAIRAIVRT